MRRTWGIAGLMVAAGLIGSANASAEPMEPLTLEVLLLDETGTGVPADTLREAQDQASRIFALSGIHIVWVTGRLPQGRGMTLKMVSASPTAKSRNPSVLGVAIGTKDAKGTVAWLFYNRIEDHRRLFDMEVSLLLGHVMAHEMGHLLLPYGSHTASGIMKGGWDRTQAQLATFGVLGFAAGQTAQIHARLGSAAGTVDRQHVQR